MKKKKIMSLALVVLVLVASLVIPTSAVENLPEDGVAPCWNYVSDIIISLNFSGTSGNATVDVSRIYNVTTSIAGTLTVYKLVDDQWVYVKTTSGVSPYSLSIELNFDATSGTTYKALAEITAYGSTDAESISAYDIRTCP